MTFSAQVNKTISKSQKKLDRFMAEFTMEVYEEIVGKNPVLTGFSRASWWASINNPISSHNNAPQEYGPQYAAPQLEIGDVKFGDTVYLNNSAPYINDLERGSSKKAPQGMVRTTLVNAQQIADRVARNIR